MKLSKRLKAICFMILSSIFFTTMNLLSKLASDVSLYQKAFISNSIAFLIIAIVMLKNNISFFGRKENRKHLNIRGLCGTLSLACLYYTLDHMILSDATMLSKLGPSFAVLFGCIFLKDNINKKTSFISHFDSGWFYFNNKTKFLFQHNSIINRFMRRCLCWNRIYNDTINRRQRK